ncbi:MAG: hypothetical protein ACHQD8_04385 [Chitinophagales bacterium]
MLRIYTRLVQVIFIYICGLFFQGCNIINPKEQVPTYIHIDSFKFNVNPLLSTPLSTSHQITQIWAYYNNNPIGAFDLPATFPIITKGDTGNGQLEIAPAIAVDGLNNLVGIYPFYQYDTFTFTIQPGKIINHLPQTSYYSTTKANKISDFEGPVNFYLQAGNIPMVRASDSASRFEGYGVGSITLNAVGDSSVDSSTMAFAIPVGAAYIELNYKSQIPFYIGLQANLSNIISSTPYYLAGISPSDHWQKFYLNVADFAVQYKGTSYTLYIKANLSPDQTHGRLLLDNIQLVTF